MGIRIFLILIFSITLSLELLSIDIISTPIDFGHRKTTSRHIDVVVVHSTYNASDGDKYNKEKIILQFRRYGVAAHYLIDRNGSIYQLVADNHVAYHAGKSKLSDGSSNLNSRAIGIELMNDTIDEPTPEQYQALVRLTEKLCSHYPVRFVVRHSDIAPGRKTDPWNTDWEFFLNQLTGINITFTKDTVESVKKYKPNLY